MIITVRPKELSSASIWCRKLPWSIVYFIQAENGGLIKIGKTRDMDDRFNTIQVHCPMKLVVLAVLSREEDLGERTVHKMFAHLRQHGEWFEPGSDLLAFIAEHGQKWPDVVGEVEPRFEDFCGLVPDELLIFVMVGDKPDDSGLLTRVLEDRRQRQRRRRFS